ncbi:PDZ domain-containing protein [soil metagenome]
MRAVVALALLVAAFTVPIPIYFLYLPGPLRDVERLVEVGDERTYSSEGTLYLTTVSVDVDVTVAELVASAVDPSQDIVLKQDVIGEGGSVEQLERVQRQAMTASKQHAREVALTALGYGEPHSDGASVRQTIEDSPADGVLEAGDVIVSVNDHAVDTTCDVGAAIDRVPVGDELEMVVRRDGELETVTLTTTTSPQDGSTVVGVLLQDVNYRFDPGVEVDFETGRIAGPSAGLMLTLALYDRLTPDDLTGGRRIAGTGTIDCSGGVGPIGGIAQKVAAAESNGVEVFLAPAGNADAAEQAAHDMTIVSVSTFADALEFLEGSA